MIADPDQPDYAKLSRILNGCFIRAKKNRLAHDEEIDRQDWDDAMQEGYLHAWYTLTESTKVEDLTKFASPESYARYLLVRGCGRAITNGAYYTLANKFRLISLDKSVLEDGTTIAECIAAPEYNDMDVEFLLTHCEFEFGLTSEDANKIRAIAKVVEKTDNLSNSNRQVLKRLKAKYRVK